MSRRGYLLKLTPAEWDDLEARAREAGITKADVIRKALGWEALEQPRPEARPKPKRPPAPKPSSPPTEDEPPPLEALFQRIAARQR